MVRTSSQGDEKGNLLRRCAGKDAGLVFEVLLLISQTRPSPDGGPVVVGIDAWVGEDQL